MKRYYESHNRGEYEGMEECDDGDWVRYEDVQELQRRLDEERARLDYLEGQAIPSHLRSTVLVIDFVFPTELPFREAIDQVRGKDAPRSNT